MDKEKKDVNYLIKANTTIKEIKPMNGEKFMPQELQSYVGGFIETIDLYDGRVMVIDEMGKMKGRSPNIKATQILNMSEVLDYVVGDVVVLANNKMMY